MWSDFKTKINALTRYLNFWRFRLTCSRSRHSRRHYWIIPILRLPGDYNIITIGVAIKYVIMLINTTVYGKRFVPKHNNNINYNPSRTHSKKVVYIEVGILRTDIIGRIFAPFGSIISVIINIKIICAHTISFSARGLAGSYYTLKLCIESMFLRLFRCMLYVWCASWTWREAKFSGKSQSARACGRNIIWDETSLLPRLVVIVCTIAPWPINLYVRPVVQWFISK